MGANSLEKSTRLRSRPRKEYWDGTGRRSVVWTFAKETGFTIVSKDSDFQQLSLFFGAPPKVIWLRVGNCPTSRIEKLIRDRSVEVHTFEADPKQSLLVLA